MSGLLRGLVCVGLLSCIVEAQQAGDFYNETIGQVSKELNVVTDFGAGPNDHRDDTLNWQRAIDAAADCPNGATVRVPSGTYILGGIGLKSNVHLVFEKGVTLKPSTEKSKVMFGLGFKTERIKNVSFRCLDGRLTIDLSECPQASKYTPMMISNIENFMISDIDFIDNYTVYSCLRFVMTRMGDGVYRAENGVIRNLNLVSGGHIGYGTIQTQFAKHLYFENIAGTGGVTLRMESGAGGNIAPLKGNLFDLVARKIECTNGNAAVMISPHSRVNGKVDVDGVVGYSCASAVRIDQGDKRNGPVPGKFADGCVVRNIVAHYGTTAQIKQGRQHYIPVPLRDQLSKKRDVGGKSWVGPACSAVIDTARESKDGKFVVKLENVDQHGFKYVRKTVLTEADRVTFKVK